LRESTFSFWEDTEFNALPDKPLPPAADACQGHPGEEESWFFEAWSGDGTYINVLATVYEEKGKSRLVLFRPGKEALTREFAAPVQPGRDRLDIRIAGSHLAREGDHFLLTWYGEDLTLELEFHPVRPGWQPGHGRINYGEKGDQYLFWSVPVPRARVSGSITVAGDKAAFAGEGYSDHRRYNFPLSRNLAGGLLGRYYDDEYTLLWADFQGNLLYSGKHITALYLDRAGELLASTGNLEVQVVETRRQGKLEYPGELFLQAGTTPLVRLDSKETLALAPRMLTTLGTPGLYISYKGRLQLATRPETAVTGQGHIETFTG
jgi:hypothetical protein